MYGNSWVDYLNPISYVPDTVLEYFELDKYIDKSDELDVAKDTEQIEETQGLFSPLYTTRDAYARFGLIIIGLKDGESLSPSEKNLVEDLNNLAQNEPTGILNSNLVAEVLKNSLFIAKSRMPTRSDEWNRVYSSLFGVISQNSSQPPAYVLKEHKKNSNKARYEYLKKPLLITTGIALVSGIGIYLYNKRK